MKTMIRLTKRQMKSLEAVRLEYQKMRLDLVETIKENPDNKIQNNIYRSKILQIDKDIQRIDVSIRSCKQTIQSLS